MKPFWMTSWTLNQVFVLNIVSPNFLGFGGGRRRAPLEARNGFTPQYLENCNLAVITYVIPHNLHSVSLWIVTCILDCIDYRLFA